MITTVELPRMRFTVSAHPELISIDLIERPRRRKRTVATLIVVGLLSAGATLALAIVGL